MKYLTKEGHQIKGTDHKIFSYGFEGNTTNEIIDELKNYEECFKTAKKTRMIAKNVTNWAYTDCISLPENLTEKQIENLTRRLSELAKDVASVFVLHEESRLGNAHLHLHHIRLARSNDALLRIDENARQGLVKGTKSCLKKFYEDNGYEIAENVKRKFIVSEKDREFITKVALIESKNYEFENIFQARATLTRSPTFLRDLAYGRINNIEIKNINFKLALLERADILEKKKCINKCYKDNEDSFSEFVSTKLRIEQSITASDQTREYMLKALKPKIYTHEPETDTDAELPKSRFQQISLRLRLQNQYKETANELVSSILDCQENFEDEAFFKFEPVNFPVEKPVAKKTFKLR